MAAEHDVSEEGNVMVRVEEARAAATRYIESAILKRELAQLLMQMPIWLRTKPPWHSELPKLLVSPNHRKIQSPIFLFDEVPVVG
ncbi:hypothetical protein F3Y22_tig00110502pilonHSYRG00020 [Hibiscus syriacus]|uniref:Uncharacterized protein n=1 Tax=Hibiscus syriacus TaxID=106335 RepID=A0A6A3AGX9_HIBSY|nr:hypothetical protein F3Y22_tig00110502pilonHSYRG00020 [Hibiscus syriacus]